MNGQRAGEPNETSKNNGIFILGDIPNKTGQVKNENNDEGSDFETAITATGFGKFNLLLILVAIPPGWSSMFETTTMSYVFPAAQCDLELTLQDKGLLNAITYIGMITSAFVWGFLGDTLGRRKLLAFGLFLDAIFVFMSATSQNASLLMASKFLGGFIINGPFAALTTYVSEFHCAKYRARVQMMLGLVFSSGTVVLPALAWLVLPLNLDFELFQGAVAFHSWNVYLCLTALSPLCGAIAYLFLPESPKFLMTVGRNDKAMKVFQKIYSLNTGKPPETFPIKTLTDEIKAKGKDGHVTANRNKTQAIKEGWQQITPLFLPPYVLKLILVCTMQCFTMMSLNTLRLWLPQIFQAINDYQFYNNGTTDSLCNMMAIITPTASTVNITEGCVVNLTNNSPVYTKLIIISCVTICGYLVAGTLINKIGKKRLINILSFFSGLLAMALYFAKDSITTTIMSSLYVAFGSIAINAVLAVVVDLFPTTLRTMTVSLTMMLGRSGAILGNLIFPFLLELGCAPPFFYVGFMMISIAFISCLLPNTDMKALQ